MKRLNYDKDKFLIIDVETTRKYDNLREQDLPDYLHLRRRDLDKDSTYEEANKDFKEIGHTFDRYSMIVCISVGFFHGNDFRVQLLKGKQSDILKSLFKVVSKIQETKVLCGHNICGFDIPTIRKKAMEEGYRIQDIPSPINDVFKKPWSMGDIVMDTMVMFKGSGYLNTSMEDLASILGVKSDNSGFRGLDVPKMYWESEESRQKIYDYCNDDTITTARILCKMLGLEFNENIIHVEPPEEISPSRLLREFFILNEENVEYFDNKLSKIKTKKSKKVALDIILAGILGDDSNIHYKKLKEKYGK